MSETSPIGRAVITPTASKNHVPTMANDSNEHPGYSTIGFIYALGYIKGLMEAVHKSQV